MSTTPAEVPHAASDALMEDTLDVLSGCRRHVNTAHADVWEYVAVFCDVAAAREAEAPTTGFVHAWAYGGSGTPEVPEQAVVEIAAELGESRQAGAHLVAVAMNLSHRLTRVRAAVQSGDVDWRKAQSVASATLHLSEPVAAGVQDLLLPAGADPATSLLARITRRRLEDVIAQVQLAAEAESVDDDVEAALAARDVTIGRTDQHGVTAVEGTLSVEDGSRLASRVRQVARWLREAGDSRPAGVLRSTALGMLADPARISALRDQLRQQRAHARATAHAAVATPAPGAATDREPDSDLDSDLDSWTDVPGLPGTRLFVHHDVATGTWILDGTSATDPCAGVLSHAEAIRLVGHDHVTITPVLDLGSELSYTGYKAPPRLRTQLALRNHGTCVFPSCTRHASIPAGTASVDYDHSPPWPVGRTCSHDGAMLCEAHHRDKTFNEWHVTQPTPGTWLWRSPTHRHYLVTAGTTTRLHRAV